LGLNTTVKDGKKGGFSKLVLIGWLFSERIMHPQDLPLVYIEVKYASLLPDAQ